MIITIAITIVICLILALGALAVFFWNKWKKEQDNYREMLRIANTTAEALQKSKEETDFHIQLGMKTLSVEIKRRIKVEKERDALQDFKSSVLCPHNDHIWIDGVCKRCGRAQSLPELFGITDYGVRGDPGPRGVEESKDV